MMEKDHKNHLKNETSPYLLQHVHNPVDWYPWGEEALQKAKDENKMIIISVGYAACHWCHVMEKESFEDSLVAEVMNKHFVPIKVDREERPDVDDVYMTACHLVSGRGGWPLNAFALPDGRPFWAGTYFPKDKWVSILNQFVEIQQREPEKLEDSAQKITKGLKNIDAIVKVDATDDSFQKAELDQLVNKYLESIDYTWGGNDRVPKFPMPNNFEWLLKYGMIHNNSKAKEAVKITLDRMMQGGIYDQLGGGFARYSTDGKWIAPHFEKMLYDNGQLISLYAQAYQATKDPNYAGVIRQTLEFIERELYNGDGGFYSSLDADSEGEEGKFYTWTYEELEALVTDKELFELMSEYYNIRKHGNWEETNILYRTISDKEFASTHDLELSEFESLKRSFDQLLFSKRADKIRPRLDDKVLTSWNALMLKGYLDAYVALGDQHYLDMARKSADFIQNHMTLEDGRLHRNFKNGTANINAFMDDYALLIQAYTRFYEVTLEHDWLEKAKKHTEYAIQHFSRSDNDMFNYTSDLDDPLVARKSELSDNVIPASNSVMAKNLSQLGELYYEPQYVERAKQMLANMTHSIGSSNSPSFYSNWMQLYTDLVGPHYEIAIVGDNAIDIQKNFGDHYLPNAQFLGSTADTESIPLLKNKYVEDETLIYVCQNKSCKFPVQTVNQALELMK